MPSDLPAKMTVIEISEPGGPEVLQPAERDTPNAAQGQVLVKVSYAGVNRPDVFQRKGAYPPPAGASDIPGLEISGEIVAIGEGVDPTELGKQVCALVTGGGYAQYCLARPEHCLPVPEHLSMAEAAAMPETLFTVWHNVFQRGYARDGETLLVHGGTSGIGTMAIKLAKAFDLIAIVTCGTDEKCDVARKIGADHAINYKTEDFTARVRAITEKRGVDIILDMVAGNYTQRNLDCLAVDGRLVVIATLGGAISEIAMPKLMVKRQTVTGSTLRARTDVFKAMLADEIFREVWPLAETGELRPLMDQTFAFRDAAAAHARMDAGDHMGKIVLQVAD